MQQELHTVFCPLHSLSRGGWLIQGHLFSLPALSQPSNSSFSCPKHLGSTWVKLLLQRLQLLPALHLLCPGRRGQRGRKPLLQTFTCILKAPEEVSGPFLPELTHSTHTTILFWVCRWLLTGRICIAWSHQTQAVTHHQDHSGGYKPAPFCACTEGDRAKEKPCCPLCHLCASLPFMKTFVMQKPIASSNPKMPACLHLK